MRVLSWSCLAGAAMALSLCTSTAQSQQPYAGLQARSIKALSDQQIADLRAGRGMGLALAAELNGYPGPMHVLEHFNALGLTEAQRAKMQELFAAMKAEAIPIGEQLITQETHLDRQFAEKTITAASLAASLAGDRQHAGEAPRRSSQVSSPRRRPADAGAGSALCRVARQRRRRSRPTSASRAPAKVISRQPHVHAGIVTILDVRPPDEFMLGPPASCCKHSAARA